MKAKVWKDREAGVWRYSIDGGAVTDCLKWEDALSEVLAATSSRSAEAGLPLRILPPWHPSPFATSCRNPLTGPGT